MQRYFVSEQQMSLENVLLLGDDANHITRVMRMAEGDEILCCDGNGRTARCKIVSLAKEEVSATVVQWLTEEKELPIQVTIAQGLPKGDKLETIVQKGTELGAHAFLPFSSSRCIVKWDEKKGKKKVERLEKIAKEAAEQSHRQVIPTIEPPISFKQLLAKAKQFKYKMVAYEEEAKAGEKQQLAQLLTTMDAAQEMLCVIGPEGGLSSEEASQLQEAGFLLCGLGPRILRTETASTYVLAALSYHFELTR
ncbi:16S ribosomal RNA methyltransferase RsmE [Fictibacillus macauensis ZFHKF-1]|uniref:Ribosomal RNA small subunit methyltransferase E n=1 Tax=Fictibacillus macauensis ZFHKF-1 TaxID=1196324 RepID=I8UE90_9BACL|nr:16S rRNA (uracil(1498)-N(3))-methyltransferase [Fictibacillus macauensis]EIT85225.1 16S ribosomal RNA methyltransferase RsmE [Fictibacillus macauensis ZFHKF-1]